MGTLALIIALGIIVTFGYWSGGRHLKSPEKPKTKASKASKASKAYVISKSKAQTKLQRIK